VAQQQRPDSHQAQSTDGNAAEPTFVMTDRPITEPTVAITGTKTGANGTRLHPADPHWYLETMGVDPAVQRQGLGRRLIQPVPAPDVLIAVRARPAGQSAERHPVS
jgi:GNAT superfamily N-acetyltransferase